MCGSIITSVVILVSSSGSGPLVTRVGKRYPDSLLLMREESEETAVKQRESREEVYKSEQNEGRKGNNERKDVQQIELLSFLDFAVRASRLLVGCCLRC